MFGQSQALNSELQPYATNLMNNPTGLGAPFMSTALTASGESLAGGEGAAKQTAMDEASRTGNWGSIPSIINTASRQTGQQQSGNALNLQLQNAMQRLNQSAEGAQLLQSLGAEDLSGAGGMYNTETNAINAWSNANQGATNDMWKDIGGITKMAGSVAMAPFTGGTSLRGGGVGGNG